jgi:hypothetical protein
MFPAQTVLFREHDALAAHADLSITDNGAKGKFAHLFLSFLSETKTNAR